MVTGREIAAGQEKQEVRSKNYEVKEGASVQLFADFHVS
jgi:hypothetical protein